MSQDNGRSARISAGIAKEKKVVAKQKTQAYPKPLKDKNLAKKGGSG